jgi:hypothetical protein
MIVGNNAFKNFYLKISSPQKKLLLLIVTLPGTLPFIKVEDRQP